jgi:pimeloyl-ACP methyl ester carboxylesterase
MLDIPSEFKMIRRWIGRSLLLIATIAVLTVATLYVRFLFWRRDVIAGLTAHSTVVQTARGPVEYASYGAGPPVLILHGTPGGYDQIYEILKISSRDPKQRFIIPSRPGYLRTPLWVGRTPQQQADAFAALLDAIHVDKVAVVAGSGGGPSALRFVLQYPQRCTALVLESAVSRKWQAAPAPRGVAGLANEVFNTEFGRWLLSDLIRRSVLGDHASDPVMTAQLQAAIRTTYPFDLRKAGYDNDIQQDAVLPDWPVENIHCPTLIIHGNADTTVPYSHAEFSHRIPGSRLVTIQGGNHFAAITNPTQITAAENAFIAQQAPK